MATVRDPVSIGRHVVIWTRIWMVVQILIGMCGLATAILFPAGAVADIATADLSTWPGRMAMTLGLSLFVTVTMFAICVILSGIWIHRMTLAKRAIAGGTAITPGWAVGWFFVPLLNLFKPFDGIREAWQVSAGSENWQAAPVPASLRVWWGLWIAYSIVQNIMGNLPDSEVRGTGVLLAATGVLAVPLASLWIRIVRHISRSQSLLLSAAVFR